MKDKLSKCIGENSMSNSSTENQVGTELRSKRGRIEKNIDIDFLTYLIENDPRTYNEAMTSVDAINREMDSIMTNNTWYLIDFPSGCNTIGCKWIFRKKLRTDGTIEKFKVRLVAKGFKQNEGIDFFNTYYSVTCITTIRVLIAIASIYKLDIHQMDVKITFLNGELNEENYMDQPKGFVVPGQERKVCKLVKSLYGLKQAPK